jgi:hypothetical protein
VRERAERLGGDGAEDEEAKGLVAAEPVAEDRAEPHAADVAVEERRELQLFLRLGPSALRRPWDDGHALGGPGPEHEDPGGGHQQRHEPAEAAGWLGGFAAVNGGEQRLVLHDLQDRI